MSKQEYIWLQAVSIIAWQQQRNNDDQEPPGPLLHSIYAQAGTFSNAPTTAANDLAAAANDLAAALFICGALYVLLCAKYRLIFRVPGHFRPKRAAPNFGPILSTPHPETLAPPCFQTPGQIFPAPQRMFQINTPLTGCA